MRFLAAFLVLLGLAASARAAAPFRPCPYVSAGWSLQFSGPITSVQYDQSYPLLYVIFNNVTASVFVGVPLGVMTAFQQSGNPSMVYKNYVLPSYHALLLAQIDNCPLFFENGAPIWSD